MEMFEVGGCVAVEAGEMDARFDAVSITAGDYAGAAIVCKTSHGKNRGMPGMAPEGVAKSVDSSPDLGLNGRSCCVKF